MSQPITCPHCGQSNGTATLKSIALARTENGRTYPALARKLAPPPRPRIQTTAGAGLGILVGSTIGATLLGVLISQITVATSAQYFWETASLSAQQTGSYTWVLVFMLSFVVLFFGGFLLYQRQQRPRLQEQGVIWQQAYSRWERAAYCGHCDVAFLPGQRRTVPTNALPALLYDQPLAAEPQPAAQP